MNPSNSLPINWSTQTNAYNEQDQSPFTGSMPSFLGPSDLGASYQNPLETHRSGFSAIDQDVSMTGNEAENAATALQQLAGPSTNNTTSRPTKSDRLDWDRYKPIIKDLYIDQNKNLPETMKFMSENHSFVAR